MRVFAGCGRARSENFNATSTFIATSFNWTGRTTSTGSTGTTSSKRGRARSTSITSRAMDSLTSTLVRRDHHSASQVETIALLQEVVRLAVMQLAIGDCNATIRPSDDFKLISVHHDSYACFHSDAQQTRIRGNNLAEIAFAVGALVNVHVDRRVWEEAEPLAIPFRDIILKVRVLNPASD